MEKHSEIVARLRMVIDERYDTRAEAAEEFIEEELLPRINTTSGLTARLNEKSPFPLDDVLRMADYLNINYVWLFTGDLEGWSQVRHSRVYVEFSGASFEFDIPSKWEDELNLKLSVPPGTVGEVLVDMEEVRD